MDLLPSRPLQHQLEDENSTDSSFWEDLPIAVEPSAPPLPFEDSLNYKNNQEIRRTIRDNEKQNRRRRMGGRETSVNYINGFETNDQGDERTHHHEGNSVLTRNTNDNHLSLAAATSLNNPYSHLNTITLDGENIQIIISTANPHAHTISLGSATQQTSPTETTTVQRTVVTSQVYTQNPTIVDDDYVLVLVDPQQPSFLKNDCGDRHGRHIGICTKSRTVGSGMAIGLVTLPYLGVGVASVASIVTAYESTKDGALGDICRAVGDVILTARDRAKEISHKHQIGPKAKKGGRFVVAYICKRRFSRLRSTIQSRTQLSGMMVRSALTRTNLGTKSSSKC